MKASKNNIKISIFNTIWVVAGLGFVFLLISAKDITTGKTFEDTEISVKELEDGFYMVGKEQLKKELIKTYGNVFKTQKLGDIELQKIEDHLEKDGFIRNAEVYISSNRILHIKLEQRQPIARVLSPFSGNYYIDADGLKMPVSKLHAVRCVVINGYLPLLKNNDSLIASPSGRHLFQLCNTINKDKFLESFIDEIYVNSDGTFELTPKIGEFKITLSQMENIENKVENLKLFMKEVVAMNNWDKYEEINIDFDNQVIAKKKNN